MTTNAFVVAGTITPVLFRSDERWLPTATISLINRETGNSLAINVIAQSGNASSALVTVRGVNAGEELVSQVGTLERNSTVGFAIVYRTEGESRVVVGEQAFAASAELADQFDLVLDCSTADFVFSDVTWETSS